MEGWAMNIDLSDANEGMDMAAHVKTYENFGIFVKVSIASVAIVLIGMAIFLV
jgi:Bacterial aa3 type cytochrome c oxidase subunit IV